MKIETLNALQLLAIKKLISKGNRVLESETFNNQRYYFIKTELSNYMLAYKRDFFNSFGKIFASEGESGVGETLNNDDLKKAIQKNVNYLMFGYPNGNLYKIDIQNFLINSHKRTNDFEGKETRSISIRHLERM